MIPACAALDQSTLALLLDHDPVVADYRAFFALFDWSLVEQWQAYRSSRGRPGYPRSAYLKAFFIRIREGLTYTSELRRFLLHHPLLVMELDFVLVPDAGSLQGFDLERSVPCEYWLREQLRTFDDDLRSGALAGHRA